ncbi:methyl-accepting chemotaxis protein [Hydrogenovibrio sp. SC-1]|uniref:methyl-accepting chemotaxis protein n=1 Tax=Hydrogenovibrio sp. SC-1 TaxID=2065820 RepID=UPI000C7993BE|nr:methyl-accepting chemotaxis protein [Hydrogenovibrio sp. SC-1]PLA75316.1 methyl-accepting chemotaxis protein [Hydrogenovibrio sp. SC-1]
MHLSDIKLTHKMMAFISVISFSLLISAVLVESEVSTLVGEVDVVKTESVPFALSAAEMKKTVVEVQQWLTDISVTRGQDGLDDGFTEAEKSRQHFLEDVAEFRAMYEAENDSDNLQKLAKLEAAFEEWYKTGKHLAETYIKDGTSAGNQFMGQFDTAAEQLDTLLTPFVNDQVQEAEMMLSHAAEETQVLKSTLITVFVIIILVFIAFGTVITRSILRSIHSLEKVITKVSQTGEFKHRVEVLGKDEIGSMSIAFNQLLDNVQRALTDANKVVSSLADGQFDQRIQYEISGDLATLKAGINNSADHISDVMDQLKNVMNALVKGDFSHHVSTNAKGQYGDMLINADQALSSLNSVIADINVAMQHMNDGDFNARVTAEAQGDLALMKNNVNDSLKQIAKVVDAISEEVNAQAAGDLTKELTGNFKGQLHGLQTAINASINKLKEVVIMATNASEVVNGAAAEVSQGSNDLSKRVQQQAAALEQTSSTMHEMNSQVQNSSENAQHANQIAKDVQGKANEGTEVMQQTMEAMTAIEESSHKISDIVTLIDGIAFQTNLLALNAAVEAARAGDHGRGFAVVAGEVRALAQKAADAAKDIKNLIDETVNRVEYGSNLATQSGEMLQSINDSIDSVSKMIGQIATAATEQAEGVEQVHQAITEIDGVTQQNAALVEETSAASESLSEQATRLQQEMAFFNTGEQHIGASPAQLAAPKEPKPQQPAPKAIQPKANKAQSDDEWGEF